MAYVSQELKARIAPRVKAICAKYGVKGTLSVKHHSTLVLSLKSGKIDFFESINRIRAREEKTCIDVNVYHYKNSFDGKAMAFLSEVITALNDGNWDKSEIQTDYFNVGWYVGVKIGQWDKPYICEKV